MASAITAAFADFETGLTTVVTAVAVIGGVALLGWAGFRLGAKITNRGVGKQSEQGRKWGACTPTHKVAECIPYRELSKLYSRIKTKRR